VWEAIIAVISFVAGLVAKSLIASLKDSEFYGRYLARRVADAGKRILGPRIQIQPIGLKESGFDHNRFQVMQVAVRNWRRVPGHTLLDPQFVPKTEEIFNLFFSYPVNNARVFTQFFSSRWEPLPEPERRGVPFGLPPGVWVTLDCNEQARVDVAGLSSWGDCYGATSSIRERWVLEGTGDANLDIPLGVGEFYLRVSVVDDKRGIIFACSDFLLKYGDSVETFQLSEAGSR